MSLTKKYPLPIYDPPAVYTDFNGGINTSLNNETLQQNEIRDGLNCHYNNSALINRPGASLIKKLKFDIVTNRYQGDFLFAAKNKTWIISVRNGHIFYGAYGTDLEIPMTLLYVNIHRTEKFDDPTNYIANLPTYEDVDLNIEHEGFIYKYYTNRTTDAETGETIIDKSQFIETLIIQNTKRVQGIPVTIKMNNKQGRKVDTPVFLMATGTRILKIIEGEDENGSDILYGEILDAKVPNAWEYARIGVNNLSPFPNHHVVEYAGSPMTEIGHILTEPKELSLDKDTWTFKAIISWQNGWDKADFYYKWEVQIKGTDKWVPIWYWNAELNTGKATSKGKHTISVKVSDLQTLLGINIQAGQEILIRCALTSKFAKGYNVEKESYYNELDDQGDFVSEQASAVYSRTHITKKILSTYEPGENDVDQYFYNIHSCTKVIADGQKALFYDDAYNTGEWYKTVINQYNYMTYNGCLNFKTTKNESITGVVVFDTNIVVFADNPQLGGNISVVTGNGDDNSSDQYYSPYKRNIVNTNVSCDAFNTIQVADNYIIFKYRNDIYMLDTNGLSTSDTVKVETINDMVKQRLNNIEFPLNRVRHPRDGEHLEYDFHELNQCLKPDEIFSEVCDGYYGLIFPNQGFFMDMLNIPTVIDKEYGGSKEEYKGTFIENVSIKPGLRWKCYFRDGKMYQNHTKPQYPWLRDVSNLLDVVSVLYIEGLPCFVRKDGDLIRFDNPSGTSYTGDEYKLRFRSKAYNMENSALCKFLDNLCLYYNRDFDTIAYTTLWVHNEAGYEIYGPENEAYITTLLGDTDQVRYGERIKFDDALNLQNMDNMLNLESKLSSEEGEGTYAPIEQYENRIYTDPIDKPVEILNSYKGIKNDKDKWVRPVLNRPSFTSKTYTPRWRFPFLSAQVTLEIKVNQAFSLCSLNFSYTTSDMPDFTREKLYRDIIR